MVLEEHTVENTNGKSPTSTTNSFTDLTLPESINPDFSSSSHPSLRAFRIGTQHTSCRTFISKPALNRRTRRHLARIVTSSSLKTVSAADTKPSKAILKLKRLMDRPPGCSFLGSKATEVEVSINGLIDSIHLIFDSGSDITLISEKAYNALQTKAKIRQGQKINLVQVTGKTTISGYVPLNLYFKTAEGPIELRIEAYVVRGMSTPLILGNDFADQYALSLVRRETQTFLQFGSSGREEKSRFSTLWVLLSSTMKAMRSKYPITPDPSRIPHSNSVAYELNELDDGCLLTSIQVTF